ncbi:hypothetical protein Dimus_039429 [Dionaea muscipula]
MKSKESQHDVKKIYKELRDLKASNVALTKSNVALEAQIKSLRADIPSMIDKTVERERNTLFDKLYDFFSRSQFGAREGDKRPGTPETPVFGSTDAIKALAVAASSELHKDHGFAHDDIADQEPKDDIANLAADDATHFEPKDDVGQWEGSQCVQKSFLNFSEARTSMCGRWSRKPKNQNGSCSRTSKNLNNSVMWGQSYIQMRGGSKLLNQKMLNSIRFEEDRFGREC